MKDSECVQLLQWALPRLGLDWRGFRKVRKLVCRRAARRMQQLGIAEARGFQAYLEQNPAEWGALERLCSITISRFYRDRSVFEFLEHEVLPAIAGLALQRGDRELKCWSAGCASGEEAYTLGILWNLALRPRFPALELRILATDTNPGALARARRGCFRASSLKELPPEWRAAAFGREGEEYCIAEEYRRGIAFEGQDIRSAMPEGVFHLIFCRNLVLTYFDLPLRREIMERLADKLVPGGALVVGIHETMPDSVPGIMPWQARLGVYRRKAGDS